RRHKTWVHEGGTCTPFIVHWPEGIKAKGELRHSYGHITDIVPTILDLAGVSLETQREVAFPGRSLRTVFEKETDQQRPIWYYHEGNRAIRIDDWKLVAAKEEPWELFHLSTDRTESNNLAVSNPDKVIEMGKQWEKMLDEIREVAPQKSTEKKKVSVTTENLEVQITGKYRLITTNVKKFEARDAEKYLRTSGLRRPVKLQFIKMYKLD
ncbi:MAG TPA: sulfatase/phosphatase domain-containing protein, partial [Draconibacterium sp.]|nr:sulfatase/phosphatase domain-containing protein [Draconibacterium sp.]